MNRDMPEGQRNHLGRGPINRSRPNPDSWRQGGSQTSIRRQRNASSTVSKNNWKIHNNYNEQQSKDEQTFISNKKPRPECTMGFQFLNKLVANEDLQQIILSVSNDRNGFAALLKSQNISDDMVVLLVKLLGRISECVFHQSKIAIYTLVLQSRFIDKVKLYIGDIINQNMHRRNHNKYFWDNTEDFWKHLISFSRAVQELIPMGYCGIIQGLLKHMSIFIPLIEAEQPISISDEIKSQVANLLIVVEKSIEDIEVKKKSGLPDASNQSNLEPPDDFRGIEIIPSPQEILSDVSPFLRPNIIDKPFSSISQYLDIQFRLLREDFVAPLRRGINTFLRNELKPKNEWNKLESIKIYRPVRFLSIVSVNEYNCYRIEFNLGKKKRVLSYQNSRNFMFGSLVCFTCDNFRHFIFGTIVQRDKELVDAGILVVGFTENVEIDFGTDYLMVESKIYFEPYKQVLRALKDFKMDSFPMEKYIIKVKTDSDPPSYLVGVVNYQIENDNFCPFEFPSRPFYNFNESQLSAYKAALTSEFAIIQGPPGTGKTYLGLKVVSTLLQNYHVWYNHTPILIICYTNHALDQFLEGILPETKRILRVGGQSKNANLEPYNLFNRKRGDSGSAALHQKKIEVRTYMEQQHYLMDIITLIEKNDSILNFCLFSGVINNYENTWFSIAESVRIKQWLMEGKNGHRRRINAGRLARGQVNLQTYDDHNEKPLGVADLEDDQMSLEIQDYIFEDLNSHKSTPLLSLGQLFDELERLNIELQSVCQEEQYRNTILLQESIQLNIWEIETDLLYLEHQLKYYQNPVNRTRPNHIDLTRPFRMEYSDRWKLYFSWVDQYVAWVMKACRTNSIAFRKTYQVYQEMQEMENTKIMRDHLVVGMTTTGAARCKSSLQALRCPIVIVEEAAEVLEAHIVVSLTGSCKQLILIGDHLQLKPGAADYRIQTKYKLGISLFERMVLNNVTCHTLNVQHRMRPEICKLIKPHIYSDLLDHESTFNKPPILGVEKCLYFIDHQEPEQMCEDESKRNIHESTFLIAFARHLILNGYEPQQITILAAYLGQMFEMLIEKKKPNNSLLLQDVRISVLDNYQGEESDIILLSLVRSNTEKKMGFLRIQNRVCVALSRARNGLFIMGNMSLMLSSNSENEIWSKVNNVLEEQKAIGPHLNLRCQVHPFQITQVSKSADFDQISEGGCNLVCKAELVCGHTCKRLCHIQDRNHLQYRCIEKCLKPLCNNDELHVCLKQCYEECGPCEYPVRTIWEQCGHEVDVPCHVDRAKYNCKELVHTKLPCGHENQKPCHMDPQMFDCLFPCDTRVEPCGHACKRTCHIRVDPDHLQYMCMEPCAKTKAGCRNPKLRHICTKLCFEECEECNVIVLQSRSCGHKFKIDCKRNVEESDCSKPCKLNLACGHPCKNKCSEDCGPCVFKVEKTIPSCGHSIKINCSENAERQHCNSQTCHRLLACGHKCWNRCKDECTKFCDELVDCEIESSCGHVLKKIKCHLKSSSDLKSLLKHCTEPCNTVLKCSHKCPGTCGECVQSRFHKRCNETCGVPLLCNHKCMIPCRESCKPCTRPCEMKCSHSKCKKKCGEPCTPCQQPCKRHCKHLRCTRRCGEICDVNPCEERCLKLLKKCGHQCVGFCGDICPPLCRICDKEELTDIFFGNEDDEDAMFVLLNDCGHVLESTNLEIWMNEGADQIQFKKCPKCTANITTTERYSDYIKTAILDVTSAKMKLSGGSKENESLRGKLSRTLRTLHRLSRVSLASEKLEKTFTSLFTRLEPKRNCRIQSINKIELRAIESKIQVLTYITQCFKKGTNTFKNDDLSILQMELILEVLMRSEDHITDQEIDDMELEIKRLQRAVEFDYINKQASFIFAHTTDAEIKKLASDIQAIMCGNTRYSDTLDSDLKSKLQQLALKIKCTLEITDQERVEIVKAMAFPLGHWYKCPNGHPYCIADCGGAVGVATCFCGEAIGGRQHRLLPTNQIATEMDGSTTSAWPGPLY